MSASPHPRRFYQSAVPIETEGGFGVSLDGRVPRTPAKASLIVPNHALAALVAQEWEAQGEHIVPASMPLTRLINVAIDRAIETRDAMIEEVVRYAGTDLVCYRAPNPKTLVTAQASAWDPLMHWAAAHHGVTLTTTFDAMAIPQPATSLSALRKAIECYDQWHLTALAFANGLAGSAIIALALVNRFIDGETAFKAIRVEENWQAARWGADPDEEHVANARRLDLLAVSAMVASLSGSAQHELRKSSLSY
jgi:chaperone required for assembly of F1-ATPase